MELLSLSKEELMNANGGIVFTTAGAVIGIKLAAGAAKYGAGKMVIGKLTTAGLLVDGGIIYALTGYKN